jgi:N-acetylneuraminic acid mutarotase
MRHMGYRSRLAAAMALATLATGAASAQAATWQAAAPLPQARSQVGVGSLAGRLYAVAGLGQWDAGSGSFAITDTVFRYDPVADAWVDVAPFPAASFDVGVTASGSSLYALGGVTDVAHGPGAVSRTVYRYDPGADAWHAVSTMPRARQGGLVASGWRGRIWTAGGSDPATGRHWRAIDVYLPRVRHWVKRARVPRHFRPVAMASAGGRMFVFGQIPGGRLQLRAYVRGQGWVDRGIVPKPRTLLSFAGVSAATGADGRIYLVGGYRESSALAVPDNRTVIYDPRSGEWSQGPSHMTRGGAPGVVALGGRIMVVGGLDDQLGAPVDTVVGLAASG